jgi:hypothetical protein
MIPALIVNIIWTIACLALNKSWSRYVKEAENESD